MSPDRFCRCHTLTARCRRARNSLCVHTLASLSFGILVALELATMATPKAATAERPIPGDLLIHQVSHWAGVLLVGPDRDDPQLSCQTYAAALAHAERLAAHSSADVWLTSNGAFFERLATYRH